MASEANHMMEEEYSYTNEDAAAYPDITKLFEEAYDRLDRFVNWLESYLELDIRTAQQDCFNAEFMMDYLVNQFEKSVTDMNEFELRWFLFSHYIRHAHADAETEERLPDSLLRFFHFLEAEEVVNIPGWVKNTLSERGYYLRRRNEYATLDKDKELVWQNGYRRWSAELEDHLDALCLWMPRDMGKEMAWGEQGGWKEGTLRKEAIQRWQEEREVLLSEGWDLEAMRTRLMDSLLMWVDTPQERLGNDTPRETILQERIERSENEKSNGHSRHE